jgi:hypothetical protein
LNDVADFVQGIATNDNLKVKFQPNWKMHGIRLGEVRARAKGGQMQAAVA